MSFVRKMFASALAQNRKISFTHQKTPQTFNMLLFGAPGVGKGTFAKLIQKDFDFVQFSTGDYFRSVIKQAQNSEQELDAFTKEISEILNSGKLVDDKNVTDILKNFYANKQTFMDGAFAQSQGIILDGVPRTLRQAELLSEFQEIDLVVNFTNKEEVIVQKLAGRRLCPVCNKNFNVAHVQTDCGYSMDPLLPNGDDHTICDEDHGSPVKLITREDDLEDVIRSRLELYKEQTLPVLDFYKNNGKTQLINFEPKKGKKDYPKLKEILLSNMGEHMIRSNQ